MSEHMHEWEADLLGARCNCGRALGKKELIKRANEYETLKKSRTNIVVFIDYLDTHYKDDPWLCSLSRALQAYADALAR